MAPTPEQARDALAERLDSIPAVWQRAGLASGIADLVADLVTAIVDEGKDDPVETGPRLWAEEGNHHVTVNRDDFEELVVALNQVSDGYRVNAVDRAALRLVKAAKGVDEYLRQVGLKEGRPCRDCGHLSTAHGFLYGCDICDECSRFRP